MPQSRDMGEPLAGVGVAVASAGSCARERGLSREGAGGAGRGGAGWCGEKLQRGTRSCSPSHRAARAPRLPAQRLTAAATAARTSMLLVSAMTKKPPSGTTGISPALASAAHRMPR